MKNENHLFKMMRSVNFTYSWRTSIPGGAATGDLSMLCEAYMILILQCCEQKFSYCTPWSVRLFNGNCNKAAQLMNSQGKKESGQLKFWRDKNKLLN